MGGPIPVLHGGEGDTRPTPARRREEAVGSVQAVPRCPRDRRTGHGESPSSSHRFMSMNRCEVDSDRTDYGGPDMQNTTTKNGTNTKHFREQNLNGNILKIHSVIIMNNS